MKQITRFSCVTAFAVLCAIAVAHAQSGGGFDLIRQTIDGGGAASNNPSTGGGFTLVGTIGQPDAVADLTGGSFTLAGGFWAAGAAGSGCPADIADNDNLVNVFDLLALLANWGTDGSGADLAEPNDVVNVFDLLELLAQWGTCD